MKEAKHTAIAVPLAEQLRTVPRDAKLQIDTPNALGCMDTRSIPVGRMCHEAADAIGLPLPADSGPDFARAADFLEQYADFIRREVMSVDIERHPYLPELEQVAEDLRAAVTLGDLS